MSHTIFVLSLSVQSTAEFYGLLFLLYCNLGRALQSDHSVRWQGREMLSIMATTANMDPNSFSSTILDKALRQQVKEELANTERHTATKIQLE